MKINNIMKNKRLQIVKLRLEIENLYVELDKLKTNYHLEKFEIRDKIKKLRNEIKVLNSKETDNIKMVIEKIDNFDREFNKIVDDMEKEVETDDEKEE
jgi:hypothetical protein